MQDNLGAFKFTSGATGKLVPEKFKSFIFYAFFDKSTDHCQLSILGLMYKMNFHWINYTIVLVLGRAVEVKLKQIEAFATNIDIASLVIVNLNSVSIIDYNRLGFAVMKTHANPNAF